MPSRRRALRRTIAPWAAACSDVASPAASSSANPMIDVSGVRRSCDIDASSSWRARRADSTASWRSSWSPTRRASTSMSRTCSPPSSSCASPETQQNVP